MNDILKVLLSLSFYDSLLIIVLFVCKRFLKNKISRQWQYYIWLIVIIRLLMPFATKTTLIGYIFQTIDHTVIQPVIVQHQQQNQADLQNIYFINTEQDDQWNISQIEIQSIKQSIQIIITLIINNIWLIWFVIAFVLLIRKITIYQSRYINAGQLPVSNIELLDSFSIIAGQAGINAYRALCQSSYILSTAYWVLPSMYCDTKHRYIRKRLSIYHVT